MTLTDAQIAKLGAILAAMPASAGSSDISDLVAKLPQVPGIHRWVSILLYCGQDHPYVKIGGGIGLGFYLGMKLAESEQMERMFGGEAVKP